VSSDPRCLNPYNGVWRCYAEDVGIEGGVASAEEAAVHIVEP
jgi:Family of unknown function (DUF5709)